MKANIDAIKYVVQAVLDKPDLKPLDISELVTEKFSHLELYYATILLRDANFLIVNENRVNAVLNPDKLSKLSIERLTWNGHCVFEHNFFENAKWSELDDSKK